MSILWKILTKFESPSGLSDDALYVFATCNTEPSQRTTAKMWPHRSTDFGTATARALANAARALAGDPSPTSAMKAAVVSNSARFRSPISKERIQFPGWSNVKMVLFEKGWSGTRGPLVVGGIIRTTK